MSLAGQAHAYSYAAAGKEVLIDAREAIFKAVNAGDFAAAQDAAHSISIEIGYLDQKYAPGLKGTVQTALGSKDAKAIAAALREVFSAEIKRRLEAGAKSLNDYQAAKVLVVKSKRFFDAMAAEVPGPTREAIDVGLRKALEAIGNPGVFGVGKKPADPVAYKAAVTDVLKALAQ